MTLDQFGGLILLGLGAVTSVFVMIEGAGGWTLFCAELKRKGKK